MAKCRLRDARRRSADEGDRGHAALADRLAQSYSISRGARCTYSCTPRREFATLERDSPQDARRNSSRFGASVRLGEKVWSGDQADNGCPQRLHTLRSEERRVGKESTARIGAF